MIEHCGRLLYGFKNAHSVVVDVADSRIAWRARPHYYVYIKRSQGVAVIGSFS
jgi:hypothetical protein